jgi:hypothetical protein
MNEMEGFRSCVAAWNIPISQKKRVKSRRKKYTPRHPRKRGPSSVCFLVGHGDAHLILWVVIRYRSRVARLMETIDTQIRPAGCASKPQDQTKCRIGSKYIPALSFIAFLNLLAAP